MGNRSVGRGWLWVVLLGGVIGCSSSTGDGPGGGGSSSESSTGNGAGGGGGSSCAPPEDCLESDASCTEHVDCCEGYCDADGFCGPSDIGYVDGDPCDMDYHCVDHGYCGVDGVCTVPQCGDAGEACDGGDACCSGTCADGSCTERVSPVDECTCIAEGATCYWDDDCCRGLYCGAGTCVPWP